jgi:type II secretory pathway component GspD/PulD (secretin)
VRTPSGEPIVISGLIKNDSSENYEKIPFLGSIPVLGYLFRDTKTANDKTEIVIYIVPHLIRDTETSNDNSLALERYYRSYINGK